MEPVQVPPEVYEQMVAAVAKLERMRLRQYNSNVRWRANHPETNKLVKRAWFAKNKDKLREKRKAKKAAVAAEETSNEVAVSVTAEAVTPVLE